MFVLVSFVSEITYRAYVLDGGEEFQICQDHLHLDVHGLEVWIPVGGRIAEVDGFSLRRILALRSVRNCLGSGNIVRRTMA